MRPFFNHWWRRSAFAQTLIPAVGVAMDGYCASLFRTSAKRVVGRDEKAAPRLRKCREIVPMVPDIVETRPPEPSNKGIGLMRSLRG